MPEMGGEALTDDRGVFQGCWVSRAVAGQVLESLFCALAVVVVNRNAVSPVRPDLQWGAVAVNCRGMGRCRLMSSAINSRVRVVGPIGRLAAPTKISIETRHLEHHLRLSATDCTAHCFRNQFTAKTQFFEGQSHLIAPAGRSTGDTRPITRSPNLSRSDTHDSTMFGPFRITNPLSGGLLWKIPWRLSKFQKRRQRERLRAVDAVVATVDAAMAKKGTTVAAVELWKSTMPTEEEMLAKDKYTMFDRKEKRYRKGIHSECCPGGTGGWIEVVNVC